MRGVLVGAAVMVFAVAAEAKGKGGGEPVEVTVTKQPAGKKNFKYKVKVNAANVEQVDLKLKSTDDKGNKVDESTFLWQNIQSMKKVPIEKGKTYEVDDDLEHEAAKLDITVEKVHFKK